MFYYTSPNTTIVESRNVKFPVNDFIRYLIQNNHNKVQPSKSNDKLVVIHVPLVQ